MSRPRRYIWTLHHVVAICQECRWVEEYHGTGPVEGLAVLNAARRHHRATEHYVQVERGQHAHIGLR